MRFPKVTQQVHPANAILWAIKTYYDLITVSGTPLHYGDGLKRLFVFTSGVSTMGESDIEAITAKAIRDGLLPRSLDGFMNDCITKNCFLYGKTLAELLLQRIISISNGDIQNPAPTLKFSAIEARREFYQAPQSLLVRLQAALHDDTGLEFIRDARPVVTRLSDVAHDSDALLGRMQIDEGHLAPVSSSWGVLISCIEQLVEVLENEVKYPYEGKSYTQRAQPALKLLWFFGKLLMGDLTVVPQRKDLDLIDLDAKIRLTDGTLASIPYPLKQTIMLFEDRDSATITFKARSYLGAVSAAAFYRVDPSESS
jgi:hypothetical protein